MYYSKLFPHEGNRVFYHKFGTPLDSDAMILGKEYRGEKLGEIDGVSVRATANGHYLVFRIGRGVPATREDILIKDLRVPDSPIVPLVYGIDSRFGEFNVGDTFYMRTDYKAPNGRVLKVVQGKGPDEWPVIIPEGKDVLEAVNVVGGKMFALRMKDVKSEVTIYSLEGKAAGTHRIPGDWRGFYAVWDERSIRTASIRSSRSLRRRRSSTTTRRPGNQTCSTATRCRSIRRSMR